MRQLLEEAFDGEGAEFSILVADLAGFLILRRLVSCFHFFEALPDLDSDARFRRVAFEGGHLLSRGKEFASRVPPCLRSKLFRVGIILLPNKQRVLAKALLPPLQVTQLRQ